MLNTINKALEPQAKQLTLEFHSVGSNSFTNKDYEEDINTIFSGSLEEREGFSHCIIAYNTIKNELSDIGIFVLDKAFEIVEMEDLSKFVRADFAELTKIEANTLQEAESRSSGSLLKLKNLNPADTVHSPVALRVNEKRA